MIRETLATVEEKEARAAQAKKAEKAVAEAAAEKVRCPSLLFGCINHYSKIRLAYEDDRKMKLHRDQLEKERRDARIAAAARRAESQKTAPRETMNEDEEEEEDNLMPGTGHVLGSSAAESSSVIASDKKTD